MPTSSPPTDVLRASERRAAWAAAALWIGYAVFVVVGAARSERNRSVLHHYEGAAEAWLAAEPLYSGTDHGFLYLPVFAVLHVPFALPPFDVGAGAWRLLNVALLAGGLLHLARTGPPAARARLFLVATAFVLPFAYAAARDGQTTLAMAGGMLATAGEVARRRPVRAALAAALAVAMKPLALVLVLLAGATRRRLALPLLAGVAALLLVPFLAQAPGYVLEQHAGFVRMLGRASEPEQQRYPDLLAALRSLGVPYHPAAALAVRVAAAVGTLVLCVRLDRRLPAHAAAVALYTLAACYLLLFNPKIEHNTFALLGPALGLLAGHAWLELGRPGLASAYLLVALTLGQDRDLLEPLSGGNPRWIKPLLTLVFLGIAGVHARRVHPPCART